MVASTHLKNISQFGSFRQVGMKIKKTWNHHLENTGPKNFTPALFAFKSRSKAFFASVELESPKSESWTSKPVEGWNWKCQNKKLISEYPQHLGNSMERYYFGGRKLH